MLYNEGGDNTGSGGCGENQLRMIDWWGSSSLDVHVMYSEDADDTAKCECGKNTENDDDDDDFCDAIVVMAC